jgi:anti-sigma factor RsiW
LGGADAAHISEPTLAGHGAPEPAVDPGVFGAAMSCRELVELVTAYFDGALPDGQRIAFEQHVRQCPGCDVYLAQMRTTIQLAHDSRELEAQPEVTALLVEFRGWKARG